MDWSNEAPYKNHSERFVLTSQDQKDAYTRQYCKVYEARVAATKERILDQADETIGKGKYNYVSLTDVVADKKLFLVGIIVKRLAGRPSILKSLLTEDKMALEDYDDENEAVGCLVGETDYLELESDRQVIKLTGIGMNECATGCCVGVLGVLKTNQFEVETVIWPKMAPQPALKALRKGVVAFVSGLDLIGNIADDMLTISSFELLGQWLKGELKTDQQPFHPKKVDRLVILGQSFDSKTNNVQSVVRTLTLERQERPDSGKAMATFDKLIASLTDKLYVDVASGVGDPCSTMWPQPPIHRVCLPRAASTEKAVNLVTNPYEFDLGGARILATSGENVNDLLRMSMEWSPCDVLERMLTWQHIAPTCPDTLDGFPMADREPLVLTTTPHVLIAGNQNQAEHRWVKTTGDGGKVLTISLPKFSKYRVVCLVDVETFEVNWQMFQHDY